jgi:4-hydroxy-2-oxoheptanedioate aldolase
MIRTNALRERLRRGETLAGAFVNVFAPELIELCGLSGLDFVILDGEHAALTPETAAQLYRAAEVHKLPCVTRIGVNHPQVIQQYLESGALSVLIPLVNTPEDARRAVDAVKYPPLGKRGLAPSRVSDWGLLPGGLSEHVERSNRETLVAVQIETQEAVGNFERIMTVEGVDVVFFGPSDLSASLGLAGQPDHPRVVSLIEELSRSALQAGKVVGTIARTREEVRFWRDRGFRWLCTGITQLLTRGIEGYLEGFRES